MKSFNLLKIFIIVVILFLICVLNASLLKIININDEESYITKVLERENGDISYPYFKDYGLDKKIQTFLSEFNDIDGDITYEACIVDNKYLSLLFILPDYQTKSYLVNLNTLKEENIDVIFNKNSNEIFINKINEMLEIKYPYFIYNDIENGTGALAYYVENNQITVYFSNFTIDPSPNEYLYTKLNYEEIKDILKINYILDKNYVNENIYTLDPNKKTIAFTFDDGPNAKTTKNILTTLEKNKASATFFMLGERIEENEELVEEVLNSESEVGTHGYYHKYLVRLSSKNRSYLINEPTTLMQRLYNTSPVYFRPPYGSINSKIAKEINMPIIFWSVDPGDWKYKDADIVIDNVLSTVKDGDIVLFHDIFKSTSEAVEELLPELYVRGYQVVSVSKLAQLKGVVLENSKIYRSIK